MAMVLTFVPLAAAQGTEAPPPRMRLLDFVQAAGPIGAVLLFLSIAGLALVGDAFARIRRERLIPPLVVSRVLELTRLGRFTELLTFARSSPTMFGRIISAGLADGSWGIDAVREGIERHGKGEIAKLNQYVGYISFIATIAPMLGLLGTVIGMIKAFGLLGYTAGAATAPELAVGIAQALITTGIGLVVALPLMFFYFVLKGRVARIGNEAAGECEKMLRIMTVVINARMLNANNK